MNENKKSDNFMVCSIITLLVFMFFFAGYLTMNLNTHSSQLNFSIPFILSVVVSVLVCVLMCRGEKKPPKEKPVRTAEEQKRAEERWEWIIGGGICAVIAALMIGAYLSCTGEWSPSPSGDGRSTCKNCGRPGVFAIGLCETCADGYVDWYDRTH